MSAPARAAREERESGEGSPALPTNLVDKGLEAPLPLGERIKVRGVISFPEAPKNLRA